jgi:phosphoglycolate phosphatase
MKTLIFDFDGTIADSFEVLVHVLGQLVKKADKLEAAEIEELRGMTVMRIIKHLKIKRWQLPRLAVRGRKEMGLKIDTTLPIRGLPEVLKELHGEGYRMLILSTNSPLNIQRFLKNNGLEGCFANVYGNAGVLNKTAALKKLMSKERLAASGCLYIGDEIRDITAARKAGLDYISVSWGYNNKKSLEAQKPMILVDTPKQLADAIQKST